MVQVNIIKVFGDTFRESNEASVALAKTLSRLSQEERESAITQLCQATGINHKFWKERLASLGSKKK